MQLALSHCWRRFTLVLILWLGCFPSSGERATRQQEDLVRLLELGHDFDNHAGVRKVAEGSAAQQTAGGSTALAVDGSARLSARKFSTGRLAEHASTNASASASANASANHSRLEAQSLHGNDAKNALAVQPGHFFTQAKANSTATQSSSDNFTGGLKAASVQMHAALVDAAAALEEQQKRSDRHQTQGSRAGANATLRHKEEPSPAPEQKFAEEKAQKQEEASLGSGLATMSKAFTDPRGFLVELPGMRDFTAGMKAAIELGPNKGKCLATGEFAGYGCGDSKDFPRMCRCSGWFEMCYLPDDPKRTVDKMSKGQTKEAYEEAKALLFGKCQQSMLLMCLAGLIALVAVFFAFTTLRKVFTRSSSPS